MIYDLRDRLVPARDGNQAAKAIPEWTATIYDELDRPVTATLYKTSVSEQQLRSAAAATTESIITPAELSNPAVCTILKQLYYDDYDYAGVKPFDNNFDNTTAYPAGGDVLPITATERTTGFVTGTSVRVLGTATFLHTTHYYDDEGNLIQTAEDNILTGSDITTLQYHWDGRVLSSHTKHTTAGSGYTDFPILTKNIFDKIGRIISIEKKYGSNPFKTIATYDIDDLGRLGAKHLAPDAGGNPIESLAYSYDIHSSITGINKDYALKTSGSYDKWEHYFGLYLGYVDDVNFSKRDLSGKVSGQMWNTRGDDDQRKYDYTYDAAGRLTRASFMEKQHNATIWSTGKVDLSTGGTGTGGTIRYDLNGNLLSLQRKGIIPGATSSVMVDNLVYTYATTGNKLMKVADSGQQGSLEDFKNGTNTGDDYAYDANGNLIIDLNKGAKNAAGGAGTPIGTSGITYNHLDKPEVMHIQGKGTIRIIYDADGNKLQRTYTPDGGTARTTTYIHEFVYRDDSLSFINFEEGRVRVLTPVSTNNGYDGLEIDGNIDLPGGKRGAFDYFIRDYQQNVRMILTEETHYGINRATMEDNRSGSEEPVFGQDGVDNEVAATRANTPAGWTSNTTAKVSRLSKAGGHSIGPNVLLKVMAGDTLNAMTDYYYDSPVTNNSNPLLGDIVAGLLQAITGSSAVDPLIHGNLTAISTNLGSNVPLGSIVDPDKGTVDNIPRAYLSVIFFNERFEFIEESSTALRVSQPGDNAAPLVLSNVQAPKNGYAYIYLSNENNQPVYFDNFAVSDARGRIIEENHYYAFGLRIAGISSKKYDGGLEGSLKNDYLYQGDYAELDEDIGWHDFELRNYDAQIGRWVQMDPYGQFASPYLGMGNNPISFIDPDGGWAATGIFKGMSQLGIMATTTLSGAIIGGIVGEMIGGDSGAGKGILIGAGVGLGSNFIGGSEHLVKELAPSLEKMIADIILNAANESQAQYVGYSQRLIQNDILRRDGSRMFLDENEAYRWMFFQSLRNNFHEEFAIILENSVLVMPNNKAKSGNNQPEHYGYHWDNGNLYDPISKSNLSVVATIHTHLGKWGGPEPSVGDLNGDGDGVYFSEKTPNKPYLTIGWDGFVHGAFAANWPRRKDGKRYYSDIRITTIELKLRNYNLTNSDIITNFPLRKYLQLNLKTIKK